LRYESDWNNAGVSLWRRTYEYDANERPGSFLASSITPAPSTTAPTLMTANVVLVCLDGGGRFERDISAGPDWTSGNNIYVLQGSLSVTVFGAPGNATLAKSNGSALSNAANIPRNTPLIVNAAQAFYVEGVEMDLINNSPTETVTFLIEQIGPSADHDPPGCASRCL
jgi:hypothetical protein